VTVSCIDDSHDNAIFVMMQFAGKHANPKHRAASVRTSSPMTQMILLSSAMLPFTYLIGDKWLKPPHPTALSRRGADGSGGLTFCASSSPTSANSFGVESARNAHTDGSLHSLQKIVTFLQMSCS